MIPNDLSRTHVILNEDHVAHVSSTDFPHQYPGEDLSFNIEQFRKNCQIKVHSVSPTTMEFDLIGVDASFANALRRILIADIPTMAIENVYILNNTSIVQDEILAQRLGLIPIKADPTLFEFKQDGDAPTDLNTIVMKLEVECTRVKKGDSPDAIVNESILSGSLKFDPRADQVEKFKDNPIRPVFDDILIARMRPGQKIEAELHLVKGVGKDHAKFSPVATASYRLLPHIIIKKPITGELAEKFVSCFPEGVAEVRVINDVPTAVVVNPRKCTMSREVLRHPEFVDNVILTRKRDHFIFNIESVGIITPQDLFIQSIAILVEKCQTAQNALNYLQSH